MIYEGKMFFAKCDNCGEEYIDEHSGYSAYTEKSHMRNTLIESEWHEEDDKHYCPSCYSFDDEDNLVLVVPKNSPRR